MNSTLFPQMRASVHAFGEKRRQMNAAKQAASDIYSALVGGPSRPFMTEDVLTDNGDGSFVLRTESGERYTARLTTPGTDLDQTPDLVDYLTFVMKSREPLHKLYNDAGLRPKPNKDKIRLRSLDGFDHLLSVSLER